MGATSFGGAIQEVLCKSALVRSGIPGVDYAINPYSGCYHRCVYCYASFMNRFCSHAGEWGSWVNVKVNIAQVLRKELQSKRILGHAASYAGGPALCDDGALPVRTIQIMIASVTDPYQPVEERYRLTRQCLRELADLNYRLTGYVGVNTRFEVSVLTKSDLVLRDVDLFQNIPGVEIGMTITAHEDEVSLRYEPGAPPSSRRFEALAKLARAGVQTWGFYGPVLPYHSDSPDAVYYMLKRFRDAGVKYVLVDKFNPYPQAVARFRGAASYEARKVLDEYLRRPQDYLCRLRETVVQVAKDVDVDCRICF